MSKIIQIAVSSSSYGTDKLFMLDENGEVWYKNGEDARTGATRIHPN